MQLKTKLVTRKSDSAEVRINEVDFDAKLHAEIDAAPAAGTVEAIKLELAGLEVVIPDGVTKKADLQKLLDDAKAKAAE